MHITVPNPDDPTREPIFEGEHTAAGWTLTFGAYRAIDAEAPVEEAPPVVLVIPRSGADPYLLEPADAAAVVELVAGPGIAADEKRGVFLNREQLESWAGRALTDADVDRLAECIPNSSIPDAIATIAWADNAEDGAE